MNKKLISMLLCAVLLLTVLPLQALADEAPLYLVLGDSISTGYGLAEDEQSFVDILAADNGYAPDNRAVDSGIINGMDDTTLAPKGSATRAQVAAMLMRFLEQ